MLLKTEILILFITISIFRISEGSCLEYGHSCWGAHGKRSGKPITAIKDEFKFLKDSAESSGEKSKDHKYVLLSILLDKNALDNLQEINDISDIPLGNEIVETQLLNKNTPKVEIYSKNWNKNKYRTPLQKRKFTSKYGNKMLPTKIKYSEDEAKTDNDYLFDSSRIGFKENESLYIPEIADSNEDVKSQDILFK